MARTLLFNQSNPIPDMGFLRLAQIVGDVRQGIPPLLPISKTAWYNGVKSGIYPKPIQIKPKNDSLSCRGHPRPARAAFPTGIKKPHTLTGWVRPGVLSNRTKPF